MNTFRKYSAILLSVFLLMSFTSCYVYTTNNNGRHRGWYKNSNNPHNPNTTNPGHSKGRGRGK